MMEQDANPFSSHPMRKASREMSAEWALNVMRRAPYITVSLVRDDGVAYGVPLSLASTDDNTWYFHCALKGDKIDAIAAHPQVCLSAVTRSEPVVDTKNGSFTLLFESAIAFGKASLVTDDEEKVRALRAICERFLPQHMDAFQASIDRSLKSTAVVRIDLLAPPMGKRKAYDSHGEELKWQREENLHDA